MTTVGFDKLLTLTDSRYRLSVIVAKRAMQLEKGFPNLLSHEEYPKNRVGASHNEVAIAVQELLLDKGLTWDDALTSDADLVTSFETEHANSLVYSLTATPKKTPRFSTEQRRARSYF